MNIILSSILLPSLLFVTGQADDCRPDALDFHPSIGMKVEKVGQIPTSATDAFTYNLQPMDNVDGNVLYFLDQQFGIIYHYDTLTSEVKKVFDISSSEIPEGLTLDWSAPAGQTYKVKSISQGAKSNEIYVVLTSTTLPKGWNEPDAKLPAEGAFHQWVCGTDNDKEISYVRDMYRPGILPECVDNSGGLKTFTGYAVFYKYTVDNNGQLQNPEAFFVFEHFIGPGHLGGGIATVKKGKLLWTCGDCSLFGVDGSYPPQLDNEACGKIILINPKKKGSYKVVAKGIRNSQQMRIMKEKTQKKNKRNRKKKGELLVFMEIGGVTAEEVNAISLDALLDDSEIDNFGWGRSLVDGKAREGTFYVAPGNAGILGDQPPCEENAPVPEPGFVQPWVQFGRTETDFFYGISGFAVPTSKVNKLKLIWTEFNTGKLLGTTGRYKSMVTRKGFKIKVFDANNNYLENGFNDLVKEELGEVGYYRGDPRLFHFPDGQAGVFLERTGAFYKLTEIAI